MGPPRPPEPPCICRMKNMKTAMITRMGKLATSSWPQRDCCSGRAPCTDTPCAMRSSISLGSSTWGRTVSKASPSRNSPLITRPSITTSRTRSRCTASTNCEYSSSWDGVFGLKLLNTVNSTAAMMSHSSKFLPISFKGATSLPCAGKKPCAIVGIWGPPSGFTRAGRGPICHLTH